METEKVVIIGNQVWMTENLNIDKFLNGETIPQAITTEEWLKAGEDKQPAWCFYDNDISYGAKYGKLYNWYAVNDPRGLAPAGFHIPSDDELTILLEYLGGEQEAGKKLKNTSGWAENGNGTNASRFKGLPGGHRHHNANFYYGDYNCSIWSSTEDKKTNNAVFYIDLNIYDNVYRNLFSKAAGLSVRCLKN